MAKNLVIVESPAKAKTIENYLGKDFQVLSSYGHIRDLPKGGLNIDIENGFKPTYKVTTDKKEVVSKLKSAIKTSNTVWLATDDDREGEAISWHLYEALDLTKKDTRRIVFREITKNAILNAIESPREINTGLVNAQQARRILDRIVGYELSPILWKKVKRGLSAGRVQSVAVRLIVEREREIIDFKSEDYYKVTADFLVEGKTLKAEVSSKFKSKEEAYAFIENCQKSDFSIKDLEKKPSTKNPAPPFTTSTLQQEASRKLGFSVAQTMTVAQRLYESGKITYMRTDSVNLSQFAVDAATSEVSKAYGDNYVEVRKYKSKSESSQEAHEAIRPTDFAKHRVDGERNEQRLYELIWKRAIASQMSSAQIEKTIATINVSQDEKTFRAQGEVVKFDGFLKVYIESNDDEEEEEGEAKGMLPPLKIGQELGYQSILASQRFTKHPARYSEASLVRKLEELGIGRPSTYAPTISTVQKRGYVVKEARDGKERQAEQITLQKGEIKESLKTEGYGAEKGKLFPTDIAMIVNDFLVSHFPNVTNFSFTANIEKKFDEIEHGGLEWVNMIDQFYGDFHTKVETTESLEEYVKNSRELGTDPKTGRTVLVRLAKFGPVAQIGAKEELQEDEKPQYANLRTGQMIESITLEEALELFKLPRNLGEFEGSDVTVAVGRFGPYVKHKKLFASIPKEMDPMTITYDEAVVLVKEKQEAEKNKYIKTFDDNDEVFVLNGRYGPYIKVGKKNVKIPKEIEDPKTLTLKQCLELAEKAPEKKGRRKAAKKK